MAKFGILHEKTMEVCMLVTQVDSVECIRIIIKEETIQISTLRYNKVILLLSLCWLGYQVQKRNLKQKKSGDCP